MDELKEWRKDVSEVASPTQIKELSKEVDDLKTFKTKSTTAWVVVQIVFGIIASHLFGYFKACYEDLPIKLTFISTLFSFPQFSEAYSMRFSIFIYFNKIYIRITI